MDAKPIQLLLLEDNAGDARLILDLLKEVGAPGFDVTLTARCDVPRNGEDDVGIDGGDAEVDHLKFLAGKFFAQENSQVTRCADRRLRIAHGG